MDDFARLAREERRTYFEQAAAGLGLAPGLVEKDFWVCWTLRRLFALDLLQGHLIFKGGTSLSKVYRIIERFSEDIDLSIDRALLGYGGDDDPERAPSGKQRRKRIDGLKAACGEFVGGRLLEEVRTVIGAALGEVGGWSVSVDADDPDLQTLIFRYPQSMGHVGASYVAPAVKIELGARSDAFPTERRQVAPYVAEALAGSMADGNTSVVVMTARRTFWEKLTILHMLHHLPATKSMPYRMSRHYYDVCRLAKEPVCEEALRDLGLLARVVEHKQVFFAAAWARYREAQPGTIRLRPAKHTLNDLRADYRNMTPMFFDTPPSFEDILGTVGELEDRINRGT